MNYGDALRLTTPDEWRLLSDEQKTSVLQCVESRMARESGRKPCPVEAKWLMTGEDGIELGYYSPSEERICVNVSQFAPDSMYGGTSDKLVETVLHEGRHAYQHQVADGLVAHNDQAEAEAWAENFKDGNYISFEENPRGYWNQPVEVDARQFASERLAQLKSEREALSPEERRGQNRIESEHARPGSLEPRSIFERQVACGQPQAHQREEAVAQGRSHAMSIL